MNCISKAIRMSNSEPLCLEGKSASLTRVKLEMESHGSVHFACHATQDLENPPKSGFYLHDGRLELADIMKQKFAVRELAFFVSMSDEHRRREAVGRGGSHGVWDAGSWISKRGGDYVVRRGSVWPHGGRKFLQISYRERKNFRRITTRLQPCCVRPA